MKIRPQVWNALCWTVGRTLVGYYIAPGVALYHRREGATCAQAGYVKQFYEEVV